LFLEEGSLIETVFGSSPDDFKDFGVYTTRLYKNGQWVEIVCDTRVPCAPPASKLVVVPGLKSATSLVPIGCRAENANELWVPLIEKAFAKFHGTYESLNGGCVGEALVDLTGGSLETIVLSSPAAMALAEGPGGKMWTLLTAHVEDKYTLVCVTVPTLDEDKLHHDRISPPPDPPKSPSTMRRMGSQSAFQRSNSITSMTGPPIPQGAGGGGQMLEKVGSSNSFSAMVPGTSGIDPGVGLSVLRAIKVGNFELVLLKNPLPGGGFSWNGDWGRRSELWAEHTEVAEELAVFGAVPVTRINDDLTVGSTSDNGTFWMAHSDFRSVFSKLHICRVFPDNRFKQYCVHGEWDAETCGGGLRCHRNDPESCAAVEIDYHNSNHQ
jgi:hypothetical protein